MLLLLVLGLTGVLATRHTTLTQGHSPEKSTDILPSIYKACWAKCDNNLGTKTSQKAVVNMISSDNVKLSDFCWPYDEARKCAKACVTEEDQEEFLEPFYRRNYLAEFICYKHVDQFEIYMPCYQNKTTLEFLFDHCRYFHLSDSTALIADAVTCANIDCALKAIPRAIQRECHDPNDSDFSNKAAALMFRLITEFISGRPRLIRLRKACKQAG
ncbi:unnamed protein product, partial [Mesorhabditis spiculigera]